MTQQSCQQNENIANISQHYLDVLVGDPLDVTISDFLVPDLERLGPNTVQNAEKPTLECVFEHGCGISLLCYLKSLQSSDF